MRAGCRSSTHLICAVGFAEAAEQHLASNWQELLLTKNLDWAPKEERRILLMEPGSIETMREFPFGR
jgi:hypothetical protein